MRRPIVFLVAAGMVPLAAGQLHAADFETERALGLIVSGSYESWTGVDIVGSFNPSTEGENEPNEDAYLTSGGEARLSFPAGDMMSIQQDLKYELNTAHLEREGSGDDDDDGVGGFDWYGFQWQATTHVSFMRDPDTGLFGIFGGIGGGKVDQVKTGTFFVGGEAQFYSGDWTFQGQAGYFDTRRLDRDGLGGDGNEAFRDAFFGRVVARWYVTPNSRWQLEASYADGVNDDDSDELDNFMLVEWGARYDTLIEDVPLVGNTNVFIRYRGHYAESEELQDEGDDNNPENFTSHTIMVGTNWNFGGNSRMEHERIGVALDSPDIVRWSQAGEILD